jgi:hypothetical protein
MFIKLINYNHIHYDTKYKSGINKLDCIPNDKDNKGLHFTDTIHWYKFYNKNIKYYAIVNSWDIFIKKEDGHYKSNQFTLLDFLPIQDLLLLDCHRLEAINTNINTLYAFQLEWLKGWEIKEYIIFKYQNGIDILRENGVDIPHDIIVNSLKYFGQNGKYLDDITRKNNLDIIVKTFPREIFYYTISDLPNDIILESVRINIFLLGELREFYNFSNYFLETLIVEHPIMYLYILTEFPDRQLELKEIFEYAIGNEKSWKILVKNKIVKIKKNKIVKKKGKEIESEII